MFKHLTREGQNNPEILPKAWYHKDSDDSKCIQRFTNNGFNLFPWQKRVAEFYAKPNPLSKLQKGFVAMDEFGSGKTLKAIAAGQCFLDYNLPRYEKGEITIKPRVILSSPAALRPNWEKAMSDWKTDSKDWEFLTTQNFPESIDCREAMLIVDELHHDGRTEIKMNKQNDQVKKGKRAQRLLRCANQASAVLGLTATPIVNKPSDIANYMAMLAIDKDEQTLLPRSRINNMNVDEIRKYGFCKFSNLTDAEKVILHEKMPLVKFGPDNDEQETGHRIPMNPIFLEAYKRVREKKRDAFMAKGRQAMNKLEESLPLERLQKIVWDFDPEWENDPMPSSFPNVISKELWLLSHIEKYHFKEKTKVGKNYKYLTLEEDKQDLKDLEVKNDLTLEERLLQKLFTWKPLAELQDAALPEYNEKLKWVINFIKDNRDAKTFVFSNFKGRGIYAIAKQLHQLRISFSIVTGDNSNERMNEIRKYNCEPGTCDDATNVILGSAAAKEGFNLMRTNFVIELDPGWNEAGSEQGYHRAIRVNSHPRVKGEPHPVVIIYRLKHVVPPGTLKNIPSPDEQLTRIGQRKSQEIDKVLRALRRVFYERKDCYALGPFPNERPSTLPTPTLPPVSIPIPIAASTTFRNQSSRSSRSNKSIKSTQRLTDKWSEISFSSKKQKRKPLSPIDLTENEQPKTQEQLPHAANVNVPNAEKPKRPRFLPPLPSTNYQSFTGIKNQHFPDDVKVNFINPQGEKRAHTYSLPLTLKELYEVISAQEGVPVKDFELRLRGNLLMKTNKVVAPLRENDTLQMMMSKLGIS